MAEFNGKKFLLENETAESIYDRYASNLPVIDYHCHLSPKEIAENKSFYDVGEMFLELDHYKWRLMRIAGIPEKYITGTSTYKEKFIHYAKSLEMAIGNPLYHWTHMELKYFFSVSEPLCESNAEKIYNYVNEKLSDGKFTVSKIFKMLKVEYIATTDDPVDTLEYHKKIQSEKIIDTKVVPTFRPDKIFKINNKDFNLYINKLSKSAGVNICSYDELLNAIRLRMDFFEKFGCNCSDHGLDYIPDNLSTYEEVKIIFENALKGKTLSREDEEKYIRYLFINLANEYKKRNWVMQIHLSVIRNKNTNITNKLGPDSGFDSVGNIVDSNAINSFFNEIEMTSGMPKTIIFTLNSVSYPILATAAGNFSTEIPGKVQIGPAWWFCDNKDGIKENLKVITNSGLLGLFNGMLTDSRSFTSYIRHDYFRRILCTHIGELIENGEFPDNEEYIKPVIENICYKNAKRFFAQIKHI